MKNSINNTSLIVGVIGCGKMGQKITSILKERKHKCYTIAPHSINADYKNFDEIDTQKIKDTDVFIDFSTGSAVLKNAQKYLCYDIPVVIGTTGWNYDKEAMFSLAKQHNSTILYGANFSIGAHLFSKTSVYLAELINSVSHYDIGLWESHHRKKQDKPSGTALVIAEKVLEKIDRKTHIVTTLPSDKPLDEKGISVASQRLGFERGFHELVVDSNFDTIKLSHSARTRNGFALGAVLASEWLVEHKDRYKGCPISVDTWIDHLLQNKSKSR